MPYSEVLKAQFCNFKAAATPEQILESCRVPVLLWSKSFKRHSSRCLFVSVS